MATDKSINIRQTQATESLADALKEVRDQLKAIRADLDELKAALVGNKPSANTSTSSRWNPPTKLEEAGQSVAKKQSGNK